MHGQDFERAIEAAETPEAVWEAYTEFSAAPKCDASTPAAASARCA